MNYKAVHIVLNKKKDTDVIIALLGNIGFDGFEEKEDELIGYILEQDFPDKEELDYVLEGYTYDVEVVADQNWNALWESNYPPVLLEDFCGIRADFHPPFEKVKHEIIINPRMSFGTGHHATTKVMMRMMQDVNFFGKKVLDFGTGTGVLAILARKMGAESVVAIDHDPNAVENAQDNVDENSITGITLICGDNPEATDENFDIILSNITRNVILGNVDKLIKRLSQKTGYILLSGFLEKDKEDMIDTFEDKGFQVVKVAQEKEWMGLYFKNN